jgi:hypothetical protein
MDRQRPILSPSPVDASRLLDPTPTYRPDEEDEPLSCEELEARLAPGGVIFKASKRTAGWGC